MFVSTRSPEEFAKFTKVETEMYAKLIGKIGLAGE
jgi:hypothetical protein